MNRADKLKIDERMRLTDVGENGDHLHLLPTNCEDRVIVFFAITDAKSGGKFPVSKLLAEFVSGFSNQHAASDICTAKSGGSVNRHSQSLLKGLIAKYGTDKLANTQAKVEEVKLAMQDNISTALERGEKLDALEDKAEDLEHHSTQFKKGSTRVHRMMRCRNYKATCVICTLVLVVIAIIIIIIATK
jgi:hypothetical protein